MRRILRVTLEVMRKTLIDDGLDGNHESDDATNCSLLLLDDFMPTTIPLPFCHAVRLIGYSSLPKSGLIFVYCFDAPSLYLFEVYILLQHTP